jgi:hypothetical protein
MRACIASHDTTPRRLARGTPPTVVQVAQRGGSPVVTGALAPLPAIAGIEVELLPSPGSAWHQTWCELAY